MKCSRRERGRWTSERDTGSREIVTESVSLIRTGGEGHLQGGGGGGGGYREREASGRNRRDRGERGGRVLAKVADWYLDASRARDREAKIRLQSVLLVPAPMVSLP